MPDDDIEIIKALGTRFIERRDVKARQDAEGNWYTVQDRDGSNRQPFTLQDFKDHLAGRTTYGHYLVNPENDYCKLFAFDIDVSKEGFCVTDDTEPEERLPCNPREVLADPNHPGSKYLRMQIRAYAAAIAMRINDLGIPAAIAVSGRKGLHVYGFCGSGPAAAARRMARTVMESGGFEPFRGENFWQRTGNDLLIKNATIEVFPKQDSLDGKDLGNLMGLPLGRHQATGKTKNFIQCVTPADAFIPIDPLAALAGRWE